jgi:uncharacterized membrane protein YjdF
MPNENFPADYILDKEGLRRMKHNGWPNYETWAVNLWLTNEPHSYEQLMAIVQNCDTPYDQAQTLREWVRFDQGEECLDLDADVLVGMSADLLAAAFDSVEWKEIIRANSEGAGDEVGSSGGVGDADNHRD